MDLQIWRDEGGRIPVSVRKDGEAAGEEEEGAAD